MAKENGPTEGNGSSMMKRFTPMEIMMGLFVLVLLASSIGYNIYSYINQAKLTQTIIDMKSAETAKPAEEGTPA
jgi:uncharacterized membrane protein SpoIIM required for sporulation